MSLQLPSPVQQLTSTFLQDKGVELWVKRDDLIHPEISGNKWRKLKYNLEEAQKLNLPILTYGGAFSNHIAATAAAGYAAGIPTYGVIRGEQSDPLNATLSLAQKYGMTLHFISRQDYRNANSSPVQQDLIERFGPFFTIPEGGYNSLGAQGCAELMEEVDRPIDFVAVACGTGTTLAGISRALLPHQQSIGVPVLKQGHFILDQVQELNAEIDPAVTPALWTTYHFGGYAKIAPELVDFANAFFRNYQIPLDLVYTAKLFYALFDQIKLGYFPPGSRIMAIHTGGLQGNLGMKERLGIQLDY